MILIGFNIQPGTLSGADRRLGSVSAAPQLSITVFGSFVLIAVPD